MGNSKNQADSGRPTHMVASTKANRGVAYGKTEKLRLINIMTQDCQYFMVLGICLFHADGCSASVDSVAPY